MITMTFNTLRCDWQWKDLSRFICLKIWPRLPNQSARALQMLNTADSKDHLKEGLQSSNYVPYSIVPYYENVRQEEKRTYGKRIHTESGCSDAHGIRMYESDK